MKTVIEIARRFNVSADTIRHYTKLGFLSPNRDSGNGYRRYGLQDEGRLRFLLSAKRLGFSLKDIREILDMAASGNSACPLVRRIIAKRLEAVRKEMEGAQRLLERMESALDHWSQLPDRAPSGDSVCHLIETWENIHTFDKDKRSRCTVMNGKSELGAVVKNIEPIMWNIRGHNRGQ